MITEFEKQQNIQEEKEYRDRIQILSQTEEFKSLLHKIYGIPPTPSMINNYVQWISTYRHPWTAIQGNTSEKKLLEFVRQNIEDYEEPEGEVRPRNWSKKPCPSCGVVRPHTHKDTCSIT
jgi:hypothetical protein